MSIFSEYNCLDQWVKIASIGTFALAVIGSVLGFCEYLRFRWDIGQKRRKLEDYLRGELGGDDNGRRSILRIISATGLTEDEVIQASFRSKHITREPFHDESGLTVGILLRYAGDDLSRHRPRKQVSSIRELRRYWIVRFRRR